MTKQRRQRYGKYFPGKIAKDRVLAHNQVRHTADMHCGINGFRWWTWHRSQKPKHFVRCGCGWAGLPHYRGNFTSKSYKCDSWSAVRKYSGWTQTAMLECYFAETA